MEKSSKLLCLLGLILVSCGQDVTRSALQIDPNVRPIEGDPGAGDNPISSFGEPIGRLSFAVTVNRALVGVIGEERAANHFAWMKTLPGINSPGAFYGIGLGNQAQIGFGLHTANLKVSDFQSVRLRVLEPSGDFEEESHLALKLVVDLACDPMNPVYRVITSDLLIPEKKDVWTNFEIKSEDPVFRFARSSSLSKSLKDLLKGSPDACLIAGNPFDLGMKRDQKTTPFQLVYGDRFYFESTAIQVDDIELTVQGKTRVEDFEP